MEKWLHHVIDDWYTPVIAYVIKNRYFTFSIGLGVLIVSLGIMYGGYVPFVFFPKGESNWIIAEVNYPLGTPFHITENTIRPSGKEGIRTQRPLPHGKGKGRPGAKHLRPVGDDPQAGLEIGETGGHVGRSGWS